MLRAESSFTDELFARMARHRTLLRASRACASPEGSTAPLAQIAEWASIACQSPGMACDRCLSPSLLRETSPLIPDRQVRPATGITHRTSEEVCVSEFARHSDLYARLDHQAAGSAPAHASGPLVSLARRAPTAGDRSSRRGRRQSRVGAGSINHLAERQLLRVARPTRSAVPHRLTDKIALPCVPGIGYNQCQFFDMLNASRAGARKMQTVFVTARRDLATPGNLGRRVDLPRASPPLLDLGALLRGALGAVHREGSDFV